MSVVLHTANRMDENPELLANARRVRPYLWLKVCGNGFPPVLGAEHHVHYVLSVGVGHASHLRCSPFYTLTSVVAFVVLGSPGPFFKSPLVAPLARQILAQPVRAGKERQKEQSRAPLARHTLAQPVRAGKERQQEQSRAPQARHTFAQPVRAGKERQQEQSRAPQARHTLAQPVRAGKERQQEQSRAPQARHTLAQPVRAGKR